MAKLADYRGRMLNHGEVLYQRGERELATLFFETLGCSVVDLGKNSDADSTYLYVYPDPDEQDRLNNVFYLSEIREPQQRLEQSLRARLRTDPELAAAMRDYQDKARTDPHGTPHVGIRYSSFASLEAVLERLERNLDPRLRGRVDTHVVRAGDPACLNPSLIQAFVFTDVIALGLFSVGQMFELQAQELGG